MALYPVAGSKIYIGGQIEDKATDFVAADFTDETWVEIDGWETAGAVGDTATLITTSLINRGRDIKQKGTRNAGSMQNNFAVIDADPGQLALIAAEKTTENYAFKIEWEGGENVAFIGIVMGAQKQGGQANTINLMQSTIEINSNIVDLP